MDIDIRTLVLFYLIANALNSGLLFLIWRLYRKHYSGLFFLLVNMCFQTISSFFLLLRGGIPDYLSIIVSSLFAVSGMIFALKGLELFFNQGKRRIYNYVLVIIFLFLVAYFTFINNNMFARNICVSGMVILITGQGCFLLFRKINVNFRRIARFTAVISLAYGILSLGRISAFFLVPQENNGFFTSGIVNSISMIAYSSLNILYTAGLIIMVSQRMLSEVHTEKDKYNKAFNSSPYSLLLTKASDGKIFEVNEGFVKTTGFQPEEVIGRTTLEVGFWSGPEDRAAFVNDLIIEDNVHEKEVKFRIKSGAILTGLLSAKRISAYGEDCLLTSVSDITEMNRIRERLEEMALHDTLTGLPNRKLFYDRADIAFANAKRGKSMVAIVSLDVDKLKSVNDQWGHAAGDHVLITVSNRLFNLLRKGDTVSRFGGDEFLILLNGITRVEDINIIVKKMIDGVAEPIPLEGNEIVISASVGIAIYPNDDSEIEELIRKSDEAMYYIKEHGRNGFMFFSDNV